MPIDTKVELVVPAEAAGLLRADPLTLPPGVDQGTLRVISTADARLTGPWMLKLVATALEDGRWPVVSEIDLTVEFAEHCLLSWHWSKAPFENLAARYLLGFRFCRRYIQVVSQSVARIGARR